MQTKVTSLKTSPVKKVENTHRINRRWSEEEEEQMLKLIAENKTYTDIGQELGRTEKAIELRLKLVAAVMLKQEKSMEEVMKATGLKKEELASEKLSFVMRKIPTNPKGKKIPNRLWTEEEQKKMFQLLKEGKSRAEVAEALNRTETAIFAKQKKVAFALFNQGEKMEEIWMATNLTEKEVTEEGLKKTQAHRKFNHKYKKANSPDASQAKIDTLQAQLDAFEARLLALENK